jgi:hypothetical protein
MRGLEGSDSGWTISPGSITVIFPTPNRTEPRAASDFRKAS